jgi:ABC-2 type transport system permease protein
MPDSTQRPRPSSFTRISLVAWREFRHTALTKGFIFGAIVVPVLMFGLIALMPLLLSDKTPPLVGTIVVADPSGTILPRAKDILEKPASMQEVAQDLAEELSTTPKDTASQVGAMSKLSDLNPAPVRVDWRSELDLALVEAIKADVRDGSAIAAVTIQPDALDPAKPATALELFIPSSLSPKHVRQLQRAFRQALEDERIARSGVDAQLLERLARAPEPATTRISPQGSEAEERTELRMIVPGAFMMLLWITIFTSANYLLTTTIEEKSNKVMEVLLAATSPMELLAGKILGYALVSVVMLVMYGGLGLAGLAAGTMLDIVPLEHLVYFILCFVMAYFMVASMMAAVGSAVSDLREAQSLVGPVMMLLIIPLVLWAPIIENPNGLLATIMSFVPPASPFVLILRLTAATEPIPLWQTLLALVWGFACAYGMVWVAARIFRVGVLMQGKPPTPRELLRWALVR